MMNNSLLFHFHNGWDTSFLKEVIPLIFLINKKQVTIKTYTYTSMAEKCNWVVKCSSRMHEALGLIPISMSKKKKKKIKKKFLNCHLYIAKPYLKK
jgi:hypothetical protein